MNDTKDFEEDTDDALSPPDAGAGETATEPAPLPSADELRLHRINEYRLQALSDPDALQANLGVLNSGLMFVACALEEILKQELGSGGITEATLTKAQPALDSQLRVLRQIERFAATAVRTAQQRRALSEKLANGTLRQPMSFPGLPMG